MKTLKSVCAIENKKFGHGVRVRYHDSDHPVCSNESFHFLKEKMSLAQAETLAATFRRDIARHGVQAFCDSEKV